MTDYKLVLTTTASEDDAQKIARALVQRRLAACVNIVPRIQSVYRWKGNVEEAQEWLLLIKTTGEAFDRVQETIQEHHSYGLPECICVPIEKGSAAYLEWIVDSVVPEE